MTDMKYVRVFTGPDGESHFEDVGVAFKADPPRRFLLSDWQSVERIRYLRFPAGLPGDRHVAPGRLIHICLTGTCAIQASDGEIRHFHPGDIFVAEDTTGKGHTFWTDNDSAVLLARIQLPG
jgi:hypothetical protein